MTTKERAEQLFREVRRAMFGTRLPDGVIAAMEQAITAAVEEEREACAILAKRMLDERTFGSTSRIGSVIAEAIRARARAEKKNDD